MSKARDKGTKGENEILDLLQRAGFGDAHRTESSRESHDIHCEPFVVEVKFAKRWMLFEWIPKLRRVAKDRPFVLFAIHGDRRSKKGSEVGRVAIFDADFAADFDVDTPMCDIQQCSQHPNSSCQPSYAPCLPSAT